MAGDRSEIFQPDAEADRREQAGAAGEHRRVAALREHLDSEVPEDQDAEIAVEIEAEVGLGSAPRTRREFRGR